MFKRGIHRPPLTELLDMNVPATMLSADFRKSS
jgi:hypothetical protein